MSELSKQEVGFNNPIIQVILLFSVLLIFWGLTQAPTLVSLGGMLNA
jgi:hypothetical protein